MTPGVMVGVLHHEKHSGGVSPACRASIGAIPPASCQSMKGVAPKPQAPLHPRTPKPPPPRHNGGFAPLEAFCRRVAGVSRLYCCNSPRLLAVRSRSGAVRPRFGVTRRPHRRPPRRQTPTTGCRGRGRLHRGHNGTWPRASLAHEPAIASTSLLFRTSTRYSVSGRGCPRSHQRVNVRISGPTLALAGPGADQRAHVRGVGPACVRAHILGAVSHAIRLSELSTASTNVAIPTTRMLGATQGRGNCMRNSSIARPTGVMRCRRRCRWWRSRWRRE